MSATKTTLTPSLKYKLIPWGAAIFAGLFATLTLFVFDRTEHERYQQQLRSETLEKLSQVRADLESRLNIELRLFAGLVAQIALNPNITDDDIDAMTVQLMKKRELVRSVGVSKQFILTHVYPMSGNQAALGLNYLEHENQREPVLRAVGTRQTVLAGPVTLVQGGQALIGRLPVFTAIPHDGKPAESFWGIVSIVIDVDLLFQQVGLNSENLEIDIVIQGRDGLGQFGDVFYGDSAILNDQGIYLDLSLPGGRWRIGGVANDKLISNTSNTIQLVHVFGSVTVFLFVAAVYFLCRQLIQQKSIILVQKQHQQEILHTATHDALTALPNRQLFTEELCHYIALAGRSKNKLAVLFLDLNRFKEINDTFGHPIGDRYLQAFSKLLTDNIRDTELLARLGGDEFGIVAINAKQLDEVSLLAERLVQIARQPIVIDEHNLSGGASIGIAIYPDDGLTPDSLIQHADIAMYAAKNEPLGGFSFFEPAMNLEVQQRKELVDNLKAGLEQEQFHLEYQPIVDINNSQVIGVEALARWRHPDKGPISPAVFIPAAETSGLIIPFGEWTATQACVDLSTQLSTLEFPVSVSFNLSPVQLHRGDPLALVEKVLSRSGIPPHKLDVEITESAILEDVAKATRIVKELRIRGVSVTIDDFGTGYSSLSHLQQLPVNRIKIDTSFVHQIGTDKQSEAIIRATLFLAKNLNLRVTAEGVETEQQLTFLKQHGCNEIQGFYFSRPLEISKACDFIRDFDLANVIGD